MPSAAESQHYVPKFILRNFLSNQKKDQVSVFQKSTGKIFHPNIKGIMTERRFNEFKIDEDFYASFESSVCRIEDLVFPIYGEMISSRIIRREPENIAHISMFIAFQMLRVRAYREGLQDVGRLVREKFSKKDWLCCTNPMTDSPRESSVVAGGHEQTHAPRLQDQELAGL